MFYDGATKTCLQTCPDGHFISSKGYGESFECVAQNEEPDCDYIFYHTDNSNQKCSKCKTGKIPEISTPLRGTAFSGTVFDWSNLKIQDPFPTSNLSVTCKADSVSHNGPIGDC